MDDLTKRDVAITAAGMIIAVLVSILAWRLVRVFARQIPDPHAVASVEI
jgi:hypothetical protein